MDVQPHDHARLRAELPRAIVAIAPEAYSQALAEEFSPLLTRHWQEIANFQDTIPLDVDWLAYQRAWAEGKLLILTARLRRELIGYCVFFLVRSPHYRSTLFGMNDVLYVAPEHRQSSVGLRLIRTAERILKERGCRKVSWHVKDRNVGGTENPLASILVHRGYEHEEIMLGRLL